MTEEELTKKIVDYFETYIFKNHIEASLKIHSKLKSYSINPIVVKYLSQLLEGNYNPEGVAKALFYPRVLGTSINTSFGARIQSMFVELEIRKFTNTISLARTNNALKGISNSDFIVGVLYGEADELSMHYKVIDKTHPVVIGKDLVYLKTSTDHNLKKKITISILLVSFLGI